MVLVTEGLAITVPKYCGAPSSPTCGSSVGQRLVFPDVSVAETYQRTICPGVDALAGMVPV